MPATYVPSEASLKAVTGDNDAYVRVFWDAYAHYDRFLEVAGWLSEVETWPQWLAKRGGVMVWTADDLLVAPKLASSDEYEMAAQRAQAMNDFTTAGQVNDALNQSFANLLSSIAKSWTNTAWKTDAADAETLFPYWAMIALSTRVATIWAVGGVPEFDAGQAVVIPADQGHACQGLDPSNPGQNNCAYAVVHTCATANSCEHQGGCGYPDLPSSFPNYNTAAGNGGCGAPIPVAQTFHSTVDGLTINGNPISIEENQSVYDAAWQIFINQNPSLDLTTDNQPTPNNLRWVLPPS